MQKPRDHRTGDKRVGFGYIHAAIDDHSRLAYAEIHDDEKGVTAAGVLERAAAFFAENGIPKIERGISDNAFAYRISTKFKEAVERIGAEQRFIKAHCPWTNGKVERLNRTLATEWAYKRKYTSSNTALTRLPPGCTSTTLNASTGIGATPISRVSPTS